MKKNIILAALSAFVMLAASCQKTAVNQVKGNGFLSFSGFTLDIDDELVTKATAANSNYTIIVIDADGKEIIKKSYGEVKNNGNMISLPAGEYTLVARSTEEEVPVAEFEQPVYGVSKEFTVTAGEVTTVGELTCTLLQCKVTVDYSDEFLEMLTGPCSAKVEVTSGSPLEYVLNADGTYDRSAGYFAVSGNTMTVIFKGNIDGGSKSMTKVFSGIAPKQWRQIKFVPKVDEEGTATFDIVIQDLISDEILNEGLLAEEGIVGDDPDAPKGDGGITLVPDYKSGCDEDIKDLTNIPIVPPAVREMSIKFRATVPAGVKKFIVNIESDNPSFVNAVTAAEAKNLDLISPTEANQVIFVLVPFPHGEELLGQKDIFFDLSNAQKEIYKYSGTHTFTMIITDNDGCKNTIPVVMVVE